MDISLIAPDRLTDAHLAAWRGLAAADSAYDSPFFDPAFTLAVARARRDVEVAVITDDGRIAGFFPFQCSSKRAGRPVRWKINDFQGAILANGATLEDAELLRACRLESYKRHSMTSATPLAEGGIACNRWRQTRERIAFRAVRSIRASTWMHPAVKWTKHIRQMLAGNQEMTR